MTVAKAKTEVKAEQAPEEPTAPAAEMNIFQRINAISAEAGALAPESKGGVPFAFRGIDGTVAHLTPFLHRYGVFAAPRVLDKAVTEREVGNRVVKTTDITVEYRFYAPDGSYVETVTSGLADDFADRSTAQAQSVAYRIALLQLFHLPTHSKEPEETGEAVAAGVAAEAPRSARAVETAKASVATAGAITQLQSQAKAIGKELGKTAAELNAKGGELSGGKPQDQWFNDADVMRGIVAWLQEAKAEQAAQ